MKPKTVGTLVFIGSVLLLLASLAVCAGSSLLGLMMNGPGPYHGNQSEVHTAFGIAGASALAFIASIAGLIYGARKLGK